MKLTKKLRVHLWTLNGNAIPGPSYIRVPLKQARKDWPGVRMGLA